MARVMTSGSLSKAGRPVFDGCSEAWSSFHQSSTSAYNETKKESRSIATPSFGESLVKHTVWAPSPLVRVTHQSSKTTKTMVPLIAHMSPWLAVRRHPGNKVALNCAATSADARTQHQQRD